MKFVEIPYFVLREEICGLAGASASDDTDDYALTCWLPPIRICLSTLIILLESEKARKIKKRTKKEKELY